MSAVVVAVSAKRSHGPDKKNQLFIRLIAGQGAEGDAHCGEKVKHRSRARFNPGLPNLRQVHLMHQELHDELNGKGFSIAPGYMGENVTTRGVDLLGLPRGARIRLGPEALIEVTGLRNPCIQLERLQEGLMQACLEDRDGVLVRKAGVMCVVLAGGEVRAGDAIVVELPPEPHEPLKPV
ncbi:MOSC domain-containing protein [Phenylobacterium sp. J367]|uniref:MOSC domain-containing protein n=1 Tax=Phenylobacterium sp. J367 TaxID=2898435 RepID=UPI0021516EE2|nr:MOSC domain-containing protein [Phenylobacterium sp. J367]MCR5880396.1 MOSC domain-containing protein [Phenylobacterium sp. J367]